MSINAILNTAYSGMRAASLRAESAAQNIVNVDTPDYKASRVQQRTLVTDAAATASTAVDAQMIGSDQPPDLLNEVVRLLEAETTYKANADVLRTGEDLSREVLDINA